MVLRGFSVDGITSSWDNVCLALVVDRSVSGAAGKPALPNGFTSTPQHSAHHLPHLSSYAAHVLFCAKDTQSTAALRNEKESENTPKLGQH